MREALNLLAELTGDASLSGKDAMCPLNFSCVSPEICNIQVKSRESYAKNAASAFSALQSNGRPIRWVEMDLIWSWSTPRRGFDKRFAIAYEQTGLLAGNTRRVEKTTGS